MLEYFKSHQEIIKNKKCLEISGGCGLISMGISLLGASEVICTELDDILQSNTKKNIENNKSTSQFENVKLEPLDWRSKEDLDRITKNYSDIDIIIACECLYVEAPFEPFLNTLIKLGKKFPKSEIIFSYKKRYVYQENCMKEIEKFFMVEEISREHFHEDFKDKENYVILKIKKKL